MQQESDSASHKNQRWCTIEAMQHKKRAGLLASSTLALAAYLAYQPPPLLIFAVLCLVMFCTLVWAFSDWPAKKKLSGVEKFGHWASLLLFCGVIVGTYGWVFGPHFVFVSPDEVRFDHAHETYVITANNAARKDVYSVLTITRFKGAATVDDFVIDIPQASIRKLDVQSADRDLTFADVEGIGGIDNVGNRVWVFAFARLHSADAREIKITSITKRKVIAESEVMSYTSKPKPIQKRGDIVLIPYHFTEEIYFDSALACFKREDDSQTSCEIKKMVQPGKIPEDGWYLFAMKSWKSDDISGGPLPERLPEE